MRVIVPGPLDWQSSLPIQMTRSPNTSLRAIAVFMMMPPDDRPRKNRWAATLRDGTAFPLWRLIAHRSMFGYRAIRICARLRAFDIHGRIVARPKPEAGRAFLLNRAIRRGRKIRRRTYVRG